MNRWCEKAEYAKAIAEKEDGKARRIENISQKRKAFLEKRGKFSG